MRARIAIPFTVALALASSLCLAQEAGKPPKPPEEGAAKGRVLKLACPSDSTYIFWIEPTAAGAEMLVSPDEFEGATHKVELADVPKEVAECVVAVVNTKTGNMARTDAKLAEGETSLALTDDEFDLVGELIVSAKGLNAGHVTIKDARDKTFRKTIVPADEGRVVFTGVAIGKVEAELAYASEKMSLTKDIKRDREKPRVEIAFSIPGVEAEKARAEKKPAAAPTKPARRPGSSILNMFLALVIVALVVWIVVGYVRRRGITMDQALGKLGVDVSPGGGPPGALPEEAVKVPEGTCPYCGQKLDPATGTCPTCAVAPAAGPSGPVPAGAARLVGSAGAALGQVYAVAGDKVTIGREPGNTVALTQDTTLSRRHAEIEKSGGAFVVRDLGSSNGTFVNGVRVTEQALNPGDEVQLGSSRFRFEVG
jgi:hypothetical protein